MSLDPQKVFISIFSVWDICSERSGKSIDDKTFRWLGKHLPVRPILEYIIFPA